MGQVDVEKVLTELKKAAATASNEEEFKINAERILYDEVISKLGLQPGRHEYALILGGKTDALYGRVIIEYKAPGKLSRPSDIAKAKEQLVKYIIKMEAETKEGRHKYLGVILSDKIAFVRYDARNKSWVMRGPYDLNRETVLRLIEAIRGLNRKKLTVDELLKDFGPRSPVARRAVRVFYDKITNPKSPKSRVLFNDWMRLFSQVCAYSPEKLRGLEKEYRISGRVDYSALLFAIHTYYALIMKLLAAEIAYLYGSGRFLKSYIDEIGDAHMRGLDSLKRALEELESGGVFRKLLNITNFIEGDYFSWYLEELDEELAGVIAEIAKALSYYEPATPVLEPEHARDLLKRLYQNLVPKEIRYNLGEYYTPDWLAELVLNEAGLTVEHFEKLAREKNDVLAPLNLRVLDPACGSGTFLVLAIKRFREYAERHYLNDVLASYLLRNVVGFDLNPLAVLAARTNYLLAIADLLPYVKGPIEIPVYLADSLLVESRGTLTGVSYVIKTSVGEFIIPKSIVDKGLLGRLLESIDRYVRLGYSIEEFKQVIKRELDNLGEAELSLIGRLYGKFLELEKEGKNHVWASIIRNAFAPLVITSSYGKFDYVVGNPPWVNWENVAEEIKPKIKELYRAYGIFPSNPNAQSKVDLSMIFAYRCIDKYLADGGVFGFLINDAAFKAMAGSGFRKFRFKKVASGEARVVPFKVKVIHDLVHIKPFEKASNRTSMFIARKGEETTFPIPYIKWFKITRGKIPQDMPLEEVVKITKTVKYYARPLGGYKPYEDVPPLLPLREKGLFDKLDRLIGNSAYRAYGGADLYPAAVYRVRILDETDEKAVSVENLAERGRKAKVKQVKAILEKDLVYPILENRGISRWRINIAAYGVIPHDSKTVRPIPENELKVRYPKTYAYLSEFKQLLLNRSDYRHYGRGQPFYFIYKLTSQTLASVKVVMNGMGDSLNAAVATPFTNAYLGSKPVIPEHVITFIPVKSEDEAHYICAILNSSLVNLILQSIAKGGKNFATPNLVNMINIMRFDPSNRIHAKLAMLSRKAHELAKVNGFSELKAVEEEIDRTVAQLYGLTEEELEDVKRGLAILGGEEVEEAEHSSNER
ncbi:Eco57I restriction-modification methylase domain-containing protein [Stetteria hydrogenophila]